MDFNTRNKQIKAALCKVYNRKDVRVVGGRGTATGWVEIKVMLDRPSDCTCNIVEQVRTWSKDKSTYKYRAQLDPLDYRSGYYCHKCKALYEIQDKRVSEIVNTCGAWFTHYTSDDGYGTERRECLTQVEVKI